MAGKVHGLGDPLHCIKCGHRDPNLHTHPPPQWAVIVRLPLLWHAPPASSNLHSSPLDVIDRIVTVPGSG